MRDLDDGFMTCFAEWHVSNDGDAFALYVVEPSPEGMAFKEIWRDGNYREGPQPSSEYCAALRSSSCSALHYPAGSVAT
jgi:hypothetical protein